MRLAGARVMSAASPHPPQPKRAARSQAAARKRGTQDAENALRRQKLMQQWQRASMLLAVSLFTMMLSVPFGALLIIGSLGVKLGIPQRYAALWLVDPGRPDGSHRSCWPSSSPDNPTMGRRARIFWLVVLIVPASTVPAAAAFAYIRREELQDDVFAEGEPPKTSLVELVAAETARTWAAGADRSARPPAAALGRLGVPRSAPESHLRRRLRPAPGTALRRGASRPRRPGGPDPRPSPTPRRAPLVIRCARSARPGVGRRHARPRLLPAARSAVTAGRVPQGRARAAEVGH